MFLTITQLMPLGTGDVCGLSVWSVLCGVSCAQSDI